MKYHLSLRKIVFGLVLSALPLCAIGKQHLAVDIRGIKGERLDNAKQHLSLEQQKNNPNLTEIDVGYFIERAPSEIKAALEPFGFYDPKITPRIQRQGDYWLARFDVNPGSVTRIEGITISVTGNGKDNPVLHNLTNEFPLKIGDKLNHKSYEDGKILLLSKVNQKGFLNAKFIQHQIRVDRINRRATIVLNLDTGPRYRFGELKFNNNFFSPKFLNRFADFQSGDYFDQIKLINLQNGLMNSDYFQLVDLKPTFREDENLDIPINVDLTNRPPNKYTFGLGYGTDTGPRGKIGWERRYLNQYGHKFNINLQASQLQNFAEAIYTIPGQHPSQDKYQAQISRTEELFYSRYSNKLQVGVSENRTLGEWDRIIGIDYQTESFRDREAVVSRRIGLLLPHLRFSHSTSDDRLNTKEGYKLVFNALGGIDALLSSTNLIQGDLRTKWIHPISTSNRIILSGEFGITFADNPENVPLSLRYFAGGDNSIRGFGYQSLGPMEADGTGNIVAVGGEGLLLGSVEYVHHIIGNWSASTFLDIGNAFDHFSDFTLEAGTGAGLRWESPVGPFRLDLAYPLTNGDNGDHGWRFHIQFGPELS